MQHHVTITVTLPICLHLDKREFHLPYKKNTQITLSSENIANEEETYLGTAKGAEIDSDSFSHYRFSRVRVKIPHLSDSRIEAGEIFSTYEKPFFNALNTFIEAARISLRRYGLRYFHDYGEFYHPPVVTSSFPKTSESKGSFSLMIKYPGGLKSLRPIRSNEEHDNIQRMLDSGIELHTLFLSDAKRSLYYKDFIFALLNSVIALEIKVSDTIRSIACSKGIKKDDINNFIKEVGLTGNIKATLKLLVPTDFKLPPDEVFAKCKSAITIRNAIMHDGRRDVPNNEIETYIDKIEEMIVICKQIADTFIGASN